MATLELSCTNSGDMMRIYRLTEYWVENEATWSQRAAGINWSVAGADGGRSIPGPALNGDCTATGRRAIDITLIVQEWSNGSPNYGIVLTDSGTNGVDFSSSETTSSPDLTVVYRSARQAVQEKPLTESTITIDFPMVLPAGFTYFWNVLVTHKRGQQIWAPSDFEFTVIAGP